MRLCMISLDAVAQPDAGRLLGLPALSALAENGVFCDNVKTVYPTLTYPIHTSLITGCYPRTHGIGHNQPFQPDTPPNMRAWYWSVKDIKVKTLYQAAKEKGMDYLKSIAKLSLINLLYHTARHFTTRRSCRGSKMLYHSGRCLRR